MQASFELSFAKARALRIIAGSRNRFSREVNFSLFHLMNNLPLVLLSSIFIDVLDTRVGTRLVRDNFTLCMFRAVGLRTFRSLL